MTCVLSSRLGIRSKDAKKSRPFKSKNYPLWTNRYLNTCVSHGQILMSFVFWCLGKGTVSNEVISRSHTISLIQRVRLVVGLRSLNPRNPSRAPWRPSPIPFAQSGIPLYAFPRFPFRYPCLGGYFLNIPQIRSASWISRRDMVTHEPNHRLKCLFFF